MNNLITISKDIPAEKLEELIAASVDSNIVLPAVEFTNKRGDTEMWLIARNAEEVQKYAEEYVKDILWSYNPRHLAQKTGVSVEIFEKLAEFANEGDGEMTSEAFAHIINDTYGLDKFIKEEVEADGAESFVPGGNKPFKFDCGYTAYLEGTFIDPEADDDDFEDERALNNITQEEAVNICARLKGKGVDISLEYTASDMTPWDAGDTENEINSHIEFYIKGGEDAVQKFVEALASEEVRFAAEELWNLDNDEEYEKVRKYGIYGSDGQCEGYIHHRESGVTTIGLVMEGDFDKDLY